MSVTVAKTLTNTKWDNAATEPYTACEAEIDIQGDVRTIKKQGPDCDKFTLDKAEDVTLTDKMFQVRFAYEMVMDSEDVATTNAALMTSSMAKVKSQTTWKVDDATDAQK
mmetsp:Transcript_34085/g.42123  ORF Transcript_34085/g.42123 Transcript_34085/m.42123 type:complete len:110 (+) Transcript_34085:371-700(+)|eukprot:CAMPEP_0170461062 /NCGR_PEP_ID=MMETSP0123-20130129/7132_1 /TAXON_ID=182087 /ORGANISM="Favella ehrenbergii, Strain Fehren 1" /LENGTH=109 /DNA_ID=CAMNT_0010726035 /DNA_START=349 /DNA_END=678 /DNA_ORIENTATION=-